MIQRLQQMLLLEQFGQKHLRIRLNRLLQIRMQFGQLSRIDIHRGLMRLTRKVMRSISGDGKVQPNPDREQQVCVLQGKVRPTSRNRARVAQRR